MASNLLVDRARCLAKKPPAMTVSEADASRVRISLMTDGRRSDAAGPPTVAARAEELGWIRLGLEFLPATERRLVRERTFEERDFASIAADCSMTRDAARMRYQRALLKLAGIVQRLQQGELDGLLTERQGADESSS